MAWGDTVWARGWNGLNAFDDWAGERAASGFDWAGRNLVGVDPHLRSGYEHGDDSKGGDGDIRNNFPSYVFAPLDADRDKERAAWDSFEARIRESAERRRREAAARAAAQAQQAAVAGPDISDAYAPLMASLQNTPWAPGNVSRSMMNAYVSEAVRPFNQELRDLATDEAETISKSNRTMAGLMAPLEERKAEAEQERRKQVIAARKAKAQELRATRSAAEGVANELGVDDGMVGTGAAQIADADDLAQVASAADAAGAIEEANLAARDSRSYASEMQDWARADAAETARDVRTRAEKARRGLRGQRAQASSQARMQAKQMAMSRADAVNQGNLDRQKFMADLIGQQVQAQQAQANMMLQAQEAQAKAAADAQRTAWERAMDYAGMSARTSQTVYGKGPDGKPAFGPAPSFGPPRPDGTTALDDLLKRFGVGGF